ncbi:MAG: hypothetical protein IH996_08675 [Proteobacteria bacterium]|nr:hypothetical protein [Pseudomonadota bacterium]
MALPVQPDAIIDRETWDAVQAQLKRNAVDRRTATNARSPSLLSGLLRDENGGRLVPSHACKTGKRYRYYISAPIEDGTSGADWRLPASEVDSVVIDGVAGLHRDQVRLIKETGLPEARPDKIESFFAKAEELAETLSEAGMAEKRRLLLKIVDRIEVRLDRIRIELIASRLLDVLGQADQRDASEHMITIDMPVKLRRRGVEKKIIIASVNQRSADPDANLIKRLRAKFPEAPP